MHAFAGGQAQHLVGEASIGIDDHVVGSRGAGYLDLLGARDPADHPAAAQLDDLVDVRVSGCQDRCDYAPNVTIWPGPYHYSNLTPAAIEQIVAQHLLKGEPVRAFLLGEQARR